MILLKRPLFIAIVAASFLVLMVAAYAAQQPPIQRPIHQQRPGQFTTSLGIEVPQEHNKTFFMQAATSNKIISAIIKVPVQIEKDAPKNPVSAIKLVPKLEKNKVRVTVYAIYGDIKGIQKCEDMDSLKTVEVDTVVAGLDKEVSVSKLMKKPFYVKMEKGPLTFRVVSKSIFTPVPNNPAGGGCGCILCNLATCCPNPGYCVDCECVTVCCRNP